MKDLIGYSIEAKDGQVGKVKDFLFDEDSLTVRYLVADTGGWMSSNKVLISPSHLSEPDLGSYSNNFPINLTKEQIENSPALDFDAPVSRQYEKALMTHYAQSPYWTEVSPVPAVIDASVDVELSETDETRSHLRSVNEVLDYDVVANDGEIGHVEDFVTDCDSWNLRFVIVDLNKWLPGGKRMFDTEWVNGILYRGHLVRLNLTKEQIENGPQFDPSTPVNEDHQRKLYDYYGRPTDTELPLATPF